MNNIKEKTSNIDFINEEDNFKSIYLECSCQDRSHLVVISRDFEHNYLYIEVQLNSYHGFFKRLWLGLKYIFNKNFNNGMWDCSLLNKSEAEQVKSFLESKS